LRRNSQPLASSKALAASHPNRRSSPFGNALSDHSLAAAKSIKKIGMIKAM
jgi:hypothetical protein